MDRVSEQLGQWMSSLPDNPMQMMALGAGTIALLGVTGYLLSRQNTYLRSMKSPISLDNQSYEVKPGHRTSHWTPDELLGKYAFSDFKTTHEAFKKGMRLSDDGKCLGVRAGKSYNWLSYEQVYEMAQQMGSALLQKGVPPNEQGMVGIFAGNCVEWVVTEQACAMYSMVVVPLYDTLGMEAVTYILQLTSMSVVVCDHPDKVRILLASINKTPYLKTLVLMTSVPNDLQQEVEQKGLEITSMKDMYMLGQETLQDPIPPAEDDTVTICFTSGTTGNPKGVMLSHKNLLSNIAGVQATNQYRLTPDKVHLSYLPLAHVFERLVQISAFMSGCKVVFLSGSVRNLLEDFKVARPAVFIAVPRILNRLYDKVMQGASESRIKSWIFHTAYNRKLAMLKKGIVTNNSIWDRLVFGKIQGMLGGRVDGVMTGSAPLSEAVMDFARVVFGCLVMEGYGQTECAGGATTTLPNEIEGGHVGVPLAGHSVKLKDVPEMDYYVKDNKGEVLVKGPSVMKGYYKDPEKTKEALDADGWLHTGDVGCWLPNGTLKIIDRRKHIFKLAQGEYIAPEKIEGVYLRSSFVGQIFVDGHSLETFTVGFIVPDNEVLIPWAKSKGLGTDMETLCKNPEVKEAIFKDITALGNSSGLKSFEQVKDIELCPTPFTLENGLLTPTFKSKRPALRLHFQAQMDDMYAKAKAQ